MQIRVNESPVSAEHPITLSALLQRLNQSPVGMAVAVNQQICPRTLWDSHLLQDGDEVLLFQAIAGG
ncbi:sulfur carrier protein ThiS [Jinshanibacter sp. LJY008]|uniref:Sulfur carrier protein ThiS n=1 Tax=Limnobaculum eriocheiris TaxID=2897391 RepID=A0A9X1MYJ6_9GAMM|nr:sulfur carrier protein ThiS [Limnobaculum eriocheiris]MCD1127209.1 sulfur carrier protein ThiS [Limnobaculum eriocheiris]